MSSGELTSLDKLEELMLLLSNGAPSRSLTIEFRSGMHTEAGSIVAWCSDASVKDGAFVSASVRRPSDDPPPRVGEIVDLLLVEAERLLREKRAAMRLQIDQMSASLAALDTKTAGAP